MRILVVGGTRFVGPPIVRRLVAAGHRVTVFHRGQHKSPLPEGVASITDPRAGIPVTEFPNSVLRVEPELVVHMIAMGEADGRLARKTFDGIARRIVMVSSGDVYRAYGYFSKLEAGPPEPVPITEQSRLRTVLHPYRAPDTPKDALEYFYDKILAEREIASSRTLPATILRLPKLYGPGDNADLATVYGFRAHPQWRWTHGYVENVAEAVALATLDERASSGVYNVGEECTPTIGQRLQCLPARPEASQIAKDGNFEQDIWYDTKLIRNELGYREVISEREAMVNTVSTFLAAQSAESASLVR